MAFMSPLAVRVQDLGFAYPGQTGTCFSHLNLEVEAGARFGLFGPQRRRQNNVNELHDRLIAF